MESKQKEADSTIVLCERRSSVSDLLCVCVRCWRDSTL